MSDVVQVYGVYVRHINILKSKQSVSMFAEQATPWTVLSVVKIGKHHCVIRCNRARTSIHLIRLCYDNIHDD